MRNIYFLFIILIPFFYACIDENNDLPDNSEAPFEGSLGIGLDGQFHQSNDTIDLILDTLDASRTLVFQIKNYGLEDIRNLKITINDTFNKITPIFISTLKGVRNVNHVEQKISLSIVHGKMYTNSLAPFPIYKARNWNHLMLSFNGYSNAQNADSIAVKMNVRLSFYARYADFEILQEDTALDLKNSKVTVTSGLDKAGPIYLFNYRNANNYKIKNTGNTKLIYTIANGHKIFRQLDTDTLYPAEIKEIALPQKLQITDTVMVFVKVNSNNIVQNIEKMLAYKNGSSYILLKNTNSK